jgi:hypothetical protein
MRFTMPLWSALCLSAASAGLAGPPVFVPLKVDGPKHDPENHSYWFGPFCECVSVADFNGDGKLDIACGRTWYEGPDFRIRHENFRDGAEPNGPETDDNNEFAMDVNGDGRNDIVVSSKAGLYVFFNEGSAPRPRGPHRLPPESTYSNWKDVHDTQ